MALKEGSSHLHISYWKIVRGMVNVSRRLETGDVGLVVVLGEFSGVPVPHAGSRA